jgi:KDO2-lipid IV(A) lauroyltransferase
MLRTVRRLAAYLVIRVVITLARILPRAWGRLLFHNLGAFCYWLFRGSRKVALANLELVYGKRLSDKDLRGMARAAFINLARFAYDIARIRRQSLDARSPMVEIVGKHHLDEALAKGKGVIAVTGHVGNWELLGSYLAFRGYPVNVLATEIRDRRLNRFLMELRRSTGLRVLERSRQLMGAVRSLKRGEILGVLIDQDTSVESVVVDFLGQPAKTAVGPVKLARRTGAPVVPIAMLMTADGGYRIEVKEGLEFDHRSGSLESEVERCSKAVESFIRKEPTQWVWMHKRWKSVVSDLYC